MRAGFVTPLHAAADRGIISPIVNRVGRYELLSQIGAGGMGSVYMGRDTVLGRQVAVKMIRSDQTGGAIDRDWLERRFLKEARIVAQLTHPNIIAIHDIGYEGGAAFIVMEYFPSRDLAAWAAHGKLEPGFLLPVIRSAAEALDYAHSRGIVHRDIKPANLLLNDAGEVRITDFGIAKSVSEATQTTQGMILGTLEYMAPEQLTGGKIGPPADQYSLAAMAYHLLTGARVFPSDSIAELSYRILNLAPSPPSQANPALPREVDRVFARALAKQPEARYASCREFAGELSHSFATTAGTTVPLHPSPRKKLPLGLAAAVVFIICAAIAAAFLWWLHPKRPLSPVVRGDSKPASVASQAGPSAPPAAAGQIAAKPPVPSTPGREAPHVERLADIYFDVGSRDALDQTQLAVLRGDAGVLKSMLQAQPGLTVRVEAHSEGGEILGETSPERADYLISIDRAEFVRRKLIELGLPGVQLVTAGLGRTQPECEAPIADCRKKNNRVHFEPGQ